MAANQLEENKEEFLFEGENLKCNKELLGGFGFVYGGHWYDQDSSVEQRMSGQTAQMKKEAVIRRIHKDDLLDGWGDTSKEFMESPSVFLLQIFGWETGKDDWRYIAVEPYSFTLFHYCNDQYRGPALPNEPQVINQLISGIKHLHDMRYVHGDLNPLNVIISQDQRIKLSDSCLSKFSYTKCPSDDLLIRIPDICKRKYWLLVRTDDETNTELIENPLEDVCATEEDDIYAAGCLIFYFLTKGLHPFGDVDDFKSIEENMNKKDPINLTKMKEEHAQMYKEPIEKMIRQPKNKVKWWREAIKTFNAALSLKIETKVLGEGSFGKVYEGKYKGFPVAVKEIKKIPSVTRLIEREIKEHIELHHDNVLKLLEVTHSNDHLNWHLVLELCAGTLKDFCEKKKEIPQLPTDGIVLYQIANGVHYIHSQNLVHRDIKPANILISTFQPVQMKVADLGLVKQITDDGSYSLSAIRGTPLYSAPELLKKLESGIRSDETILTDTFSTGCVFFYFLTRGFHPFHHEKKVDIVKWPQVKEKMIKNDPTELESRKKSLPPTFYDLISKMIDPKEKRIELPEVIKILAAELSATRGFKEVVNPIVSKCWSFCFHPTEPVLACGGEKLFFLSAANSSIPFSNWKEKSETKIQLGNICFIYDLKWNVDGTQLAVVGRLWDSRDVVCVKVWNYPSCEILFEKDLLAGFDSLEWNHFRPNVFAVVSNGFDSYSGRNVFLFHFYPDDKQKCQSYAIQQEKEIRNVQWISKNQIALGLENGRVEIYETDEKDFVFRLFKRYDHFKLKRTLYPINPEFVWDERTKCFAAVCDDGENLKICPMESDEPIYSLEINEEISSFAWRPNGKKRDDEEMDAARKSSSNFILACGLLHGNILIWTPLEEKQKKILSGHSVWVHFLSFSPDGKFLASGDRAYKLIIWSTETWNPVFIGKKNIFPSSLSWMPSSADNPEYKFICGGRDSLALEYAVGQTATSIKGSENIPPEEEDRH